jgi:hypothetical protein
MQSLKFSTLRKLIDYTNIEVPHKNPNFCSSFRWDRSRSGELKCCKVLVTFLRKPAGKHPRQGADKQVDATVVLHESRTSDSVLLTSFFFLKVGDNVEHWSNGYVATNGIPRSH